MPVDHDIWRPAQCPKCNNAIIVKTSYGVWKCPGCGYTKGENSADTDKLVTQRPTALALLEKRALNGDMAAISEVIGLLATESIVERHHAKAILVSASHYSSQVLVKTYIDLIHSREDTSLRRNILEVLSKKCQREDIPLLLSAIRKIPSLQEKSDVLEILLQQKNENILNSLIVLYSESTLPFKSRIIEAIVQISDSNAIIPLFEFCKSAESEKEKTSLIYGLEKIADSRSILPLIDLLPDSSELTRVNIFRTLGVHQSPDALNCLIECFEKSQSTKERAAIINVLSHMDDPRICGFLIAHIDDSDNHVRETIINALGVIGNKQAVSPLLDVCCHPRVAKDRHAAIFSLGSIGDVNATSEILKYLQKTTGPKKTQFFKILEKKRGYLDNIKLNVKYREVRSISAMLELILQEPTIFGKFFLDEIKNTPICLYPFFKKLSDPERKISFEIISFIGELGDPRGCDLISNYLKSCPISEKTAIVKILGKIRDRKSVGILIELMNNSDFNKKEIINTLSTMDDEKAKAFVEANTNQSPKKINAGKWSTSNNEPICLTVKSISKTPKVPIKKKKAGENKTSK